MHDSPLKALLLAFVERPRQAWTSSESFVLKTSRLTGRPVLHNSSIMPTSTTRPFVAQDEVWFDPRSVFTAMPELQRSCLHLPPPPRTAPQSAPSRMHAIRNRKGSASVSARTRTTASRRKDTVLPCASDADGVLLSSPRRVFLLMSGQ